jgi:Carboxypeptidase regulatory-like domain
VTLTAVVQGFSLAVYGKPKGLHYTWAVLFAAVAHAAAAQPPRPVESPRTVTLTVTEYNRLIDLAARPPQTPAPAPVAAVLSSADLRVRVDAQTARGTFAVTGDVLRPGVAKVALLTGATLVDATVSGRPLPLIAEGTAHTALLPGPGAFTLNLEWGAPLAFAPGKGSFVLPALAAGTVRATIDVPSEQADVRVSSGLITRRTVNGGRTLIEATLTPGSPTEVSWSMRDSAPVAAARESRVVADVMTLVTLGDSDVRMVALVDVNVVQGEPRTIDLRLPAGYELTNISGATLEKSDQDAGAVTLTLSDPTVRRHQFLVSLERPNGGGSFTIDTGFVSLPGIQRERGEVAVEGVGTLDLTSIDRDGMHRIDVRELQPALQSLARMPVLSAYRYQRTTAATPGLTLDAKRFADAGVLAAFAEHATATTMITAEGRALTEVILELENRAQPFLKVNLPEGATIVSVEVAGASAKPVLGADGVRVPLLRPGFRPHGPYTVSYVYLHAGTSFAKKGDLQMTLPRMDVPVGQVDWEVFAPENYRLRTTGGNVIEQPGMDRSIRVHLQPVVNGAPGEVHGHVTDAVGADLPGVTIELASGPFKGSTVTNSKGAFVLTGVPNGRVTLTATLAGFSTEHREWYFDQSPVRVDFVMKVGSVAETVTVSAEAPRVDTQSAAMQRASTAREREIDENSKRLVEPSQNVINLQQRAAGVLPVRIDVPRAGTSHKFVKPLVVDQETVVGFSYKRR